jgi:hypothetical protein
MFLSRPIDKTIRPDWQLSLGLTAVIRSFSIPTEGEVPFRKPFGGFVLRSLPFAGFIQDELWRFGSDRNTGCELEMAR